MNIKTQKTIDVCEFNKLVEETYGRPYSFQQQDGCKPRGTDYFTVPNPDPYDFEDDTIPEIVNGKEMGVSFKAWLTRDPKQSFPRNHDPRYMEDEFGVRLWWTRNFYPSLEVLTQDMYEKGLIEAGEYMIVIDW